MRERITTGLEVAGAVSFVSGVAVLFGLGAALMVGGLVLVALGYLGASE